MKKRAIAVAVAALSAAPAVQAQITFGNDKIGTMQIYGRLYPQLQTAKTSGAATAGTAVSTMAATTGVLGAGGFDHGTHVGIQTQNSRLGFRGERALGAGMKALWQLEQKISFEDPEDAAGGLGGVSSNDAIFATRNSFVGLAGVFGTVKLGHMDTIYKEYGDNLNMFGVKSGNLTSASNMLSHIGIGRNNAARFHERATNSVMYETPQFGGITAGIHWMPDERRGDPTVTVNRRLVSYGIKYDKGPLYLSLAQEKHRDFFGGSANVVAALRNTGDPHAKSDDTATRLSGIWRIGNHSITGDIAMMKWTEESALAAPRFKSYKHTNWAIGWEARLGGPWRGAAQYVHGAEGSCELTGTLACTTTGLKSSMISLGGAYDLDRQTRLYALAAWLKNGDSAIYDNSSLLNPSRGADITQFALGISYSF